MVHISTTFHLNIKYQKGSTNWVTNFLNRPLVIALTTMLDSCGHETSGWSKIFASDPDFTTTYQAVSEGTPVANFHLQDGSICHLGHLCVPSRKCVKLIWESHYSRVARHFEVDKKMALLQKYFYWSKLWHNVNKYIRFCTACAIAKLAIKKQGLYTPIPTVDKP